MKKIRDYMTTHVETLDPDWTVQEAARKMKDYDFGFLPVAENGRGVGVLTDRDVTLRVIAEGRDPARTLVRDVMSRDVIAAREDDELETVYELLKERQLRRLPVVDLEGRLAGMITLARIAREQGEDAAGEILKEVVVPSGPSGPAA
ncbi:MAG TPA: CBS domain-containing protein [Planctomycetota bacterium]